MSWLKLFREISPKVTSQWQSEAVQIQYGRGAGRGQERQ